MVAVGVSVTVGVAEGAMIGAAAGRLLIVDKTTITIPMITIPPSAKRIERLPPRRVDRRRTGTAARRRLGMR
jgi:hypothetical protein